MSVHRFIVDIEVDDDALAAHDGEQMAPPNEVDEWEGRDIFEAVDKGIVETYGATEIVTYEGEIDPDTGRAKR